MNLHDIPHDLSPQLQAGLRRYYGQDGWEVRYHPNERSNYQFRIRDNEPWFNWRKSEYPQYLPGGDRYREPA